MLPALNDVTHDNYRMKRKKLEIFAKACSIRGQMAITEGALAIIQGLEGNSWAIVEELDLELLDQPTAFETLTRLLDEQFQYEPEVELPNLMQTFFNKFARDNGETLRAYFLRFATLQAKLKELKLVLPPELEGWLLEARYQRGRFQMSRHAPEKDFR